MIAGHGSLLEVELEWSLCDLFDSHEALAIKAEMEAFLAEQRK